MGRYSYIRQVDPKKRPWKVHPIWRGIGCILLIIGPFMALAAAHVLVDLNIEQGWVPIPFDFWEPLVIPDVYTIDHFYADLLVGGIFLFLGFAFVMIVYSIIYSVMGPSKYGPMDSPPIRKKSRQPRRY